LPPTFELWVCNGTDMGTYPIKTLYGYGEPADTLVVAAGKLHFAAYDILNGMELWKSNGTTSGTVLAKDISPGGPGFDSFPENLTPVGNSLFFSANDGVHGRELWRGTSSVVIPKKDDNDEWYKIGDGAKSWIRTDGCSVGGGSNPMNLALLALVALFATVASRRRKSTR
jgi:MYXO-CTERM domain-containing protein